MERHYLLVAAPPRCATSFYKKRVATVRALATVGFPFVDEPTVNSKHELTVATFGS